MFKSLSKSRDYSCLNVEPGDSCVVAATPSPIHTHTVVVNFQCVIYLKKNAICYSIHHHANMYTAAPLFTYKNV